MNVYRAQPLRIEMVLPSLGLGGMEIMAVNLARCLSADGHDVGVTCTDGLGPVTAQFTALDIPVSLVPAPGIGGNFWPAALAAHIRAKSPDVVHVHSGVWFRAARAARQAGVRRIIHTVHGLHEPEPWFY